MSSVTNVSSVPGAQKAPNRRQAAKAATRQKVLDAGRSLFVEVGYEAATIRDIAGRAGMSTGAVFANFADKADLFGAVAREQARSLLAEVDAALSGAGSVEMRLLAFARTVEANWRENAPLAQAIAVRSWADPRPESGGGPANSPLIARLAALIEEGVSGGEFSADLDPGLAAEAIWDTLRGSFRRRLSDPDRPAAILTGEPKVRLLIAGFRRAAA